MHRSASRRTLVRSVVLSAGVLAACASTPAVHRPEPAIEPIHLGNEGSPPIEFDRVMLRIPFGQVVGHVYVWEQDRGEIRWEHSNSQSDEFNVSAASELAKFGYTVYEPADRLFVSEAQKVARLHLGGVINGLEMNRYFSSDHARESRLEGRMEIEFRLFDAMNDEVVFRRTYVGKATDEGANPNATSPAFVDALRQLLADAEFVAAVREPDPGAAHAAGGERPIAIEPCPADPSSQLPAGTDRLLNSFVRVLVGGARGSGVIVSGDGFVLTAAHVVKGQDGVAVQLSSGLRLDATRVRADPGQDVALLRLAGRGFPCAAVRNEEGLPSVGTDVYAFGSPLGDILGHSVTRGVISGYREIEGYEFVQTDTSLNPGDSGGPLFDASGRLIGIVSFKLVDLGVEGLGFGVPIDVIEQRLQITWTN